jgi:hypothetical protein
MLIQNLIFEEDPAAELASQSMSLQIFQTL